MKRLFLSLVLSLSAAATAATFQGLGTGSLANDISADGTVIVGSGRWTQQGGWQNIGGTANACNADGSVVVGYRRYIEPFGSIVKKPIYWTAAEGAVDISCHRGNNAEATDISDDGTVIVGYTDTVSNMASFYNEAFVYHPGEGSTVGLGDLDVLPGEDDYQNINSAAYAVSGDGTIVAGSGIETSIIPNAMYWTESTGMVNIKPGSDSFNQSCMMGVSRDGTILIGQSGPFPLFDIQAAIWTKQTEMQILGRLDGYDSESCALGISDDLSTIVGWATDGYGEYAAFLWKEPLGMVNLQEYLRDTYGCDLSGWTLTEATGISADGLTITGNGINPDGQYEAWLVTIPEPASLLLLSFGIYWLRKQQ
jgi:probable HAF family extracellular repeat protein